MTSTQPGIPAVVTGYASIWQRAVAAAKAYNDCIRSLREEERILIGAEEDWRLRLGRDEYAKLEELQKGIGGTIIEEAVKRFSPRGTRLEVDLSDFGGRGERGRRRDAEELQQFDPLALWQFLAGKYGSGQADDTVFRGVANRLVSSFDLRAGQAVKTVGGRLSLSAHLYWDDGFGTPQWGYQSQQEFGRILEDVKAVAEWAGLWDTDAEWGRRNALQEMHDQRGTPQGLRWGLGGLALIVPYQRKAEFRFDPAFGAKLQEFIGLYGVLREARPAA
jgi:hypothetical protein